MEAENWRVKIGCLFVTTCWGQGHIVAAARTACFICELCRPRTASRFFLGDVSLSPFTIRYLTKQKKIDSITEQLMQHLFVVCSAI